MAVTAFHVAWLKRYYPAEFYCSLLNEQPMGFYSPEVIANDARRHDIEIRGVDVNHSGVECSIEDDVRETRKARAPGLPLRQGPGAGGLAAAGGGAQPTVRTARCGTSGAARAWAVRRSRT